MDKEYEKKIEVHIHNGGQLNIASDNACIDAYQNNSIESDKEVVHSFLDVINGEEYIHKIFENGEEMCTIASESDVEDFPDSVIEEYKRQLGTKLNGGESKLQIISMLLQEMENTLISGKRYGVMPMFINVPRGREKGYIFLDSSVMPFDNPNIEEYYWDAYEKYVIEDKYYYFMIVLYDGQVVFIELGYTLCFPDVTERLYGFRKVKEIENAKKIILLLPTLNRKIEVDMFLLGEKRDEQIAITDYWIEQMKMVDAIEKYYKIKFHLPKKASEQEYYKIHVLYSAVNKLPTSIFPPLPMEKELFRKSFKIKEEWKINSGKKFPSIELFGYHFEPIAVYMMECTLLWKKKIKAWERKEGGIPVRVEFMCYKV